VRGLSLINLNLAHTLNLNHALNRNPLPDWRKKGEKKAGKQESRKLAGKQESKAPPVGRCGGHSTSMGCLNGMEEAGRLER
jgi:hypothetical protein